MLKNKRVSECFLLLAFLVLAVVVGDGPVTAEEDPEIRMDALQIIDRWGYVGEEHIAETDDGYLLTIHRIPYGKSGKGSGSRPVIFMQHGLECSSTNWLVNLPNESAAYMFADSGFDVWMGNFRGNTYSNRHINPDISKHQFWSFSWDEMALKDLPAMVDYVLDYTNTEQLYYMGHSEGTMTLFGLLSDNPDFGSKISKFFALGPVATVGHLAGYIRFIADFKGLLKDIFWITGADQFFPSNWFTKLAASTICEVGVTNRLICDNIMFLIAGPSTSQLNTTRVPVYVGHTPAGTSTQNMLHFAQMAVSNKFQKYDYGSAKKNSEIYGQSSPPLYDIANVDVPTYLFWGKEDILADQKDIYETIIPNVKTIKGNYGLKGFNHLDFIWGMNAPKMVYDKVLEVIQEEDNITTITRPSF